MTNSIKLIAVGDIFLKPIADQNPFEKVNTLFKKKDILFGNLETALSEEGVPTEKAVSFHTSPENAKWLSQAGFDVVSVANNHTLDLGTTGLLNTLKTLNKNNILSIGAGTDIYSDSCIIERNNLKIAFLAYCEGGYQSPKNPIWINKLDYNKILRDVNILKRECDIIIVSLHWGIEKVFYPSIEQIKLAHNLIDNGVNIILGHHPHVLQAFEEYNGGFIAYSLGNFQLEFDPGECNGLNNKRTNQSVILELIVGKDGYQSYNLIPVLLDKNYYPQPADGKQAQEILGFIQNISVPIINGKITRNWWFEQIAEEYLSGNMQSCIIRIKRYGIIHFLQCIKWLMSPFVLQCYLGVIRQKVKKLKGD